MAFARPALRPRGMEAAVASVRDLVAREGVERVVIGLPLNMDGSAGEQAARARSFGERLAAAGLRVEYHDERLTSWQARQETGAGTRRAERRSGRVDSAAARLVLQEYLDARRPGRAGSREP
jgi:putative Holliday junction resolvase